MKSSIGKGLPCLLRPARTDNGLRASCEEMEEEEEEP